MARSILASLTGFRRDHAVMETAIALAAMEGGHVEALHARIDVVETAALIEATYPRHRDNFEDAMRRIADEERARSAHARAAFDESCRRHGLMRRAAPGSVQAVWMETKSFFNETLGAARYHDITVMAKDDELPAQRIKTLLMQSGRPLVIAPPKPQAVAGRRVAIAWKEGAEAARAVTAAASILKRAEVVFVLAAAERAAEREIAAAHRLAQSLGRQGIAAQVAVDKAPSGTVSRALADLAYANDVDLLVMGAYGRGRVREMLLGGVTEDMIAGDCAIPVFLFR